MIRVMSMLKNHNLEILRKCLNRLDLGSLLRAWRAGGMRDSCPTCNNEKTVLVIFAGGSPMSGAASWSGVCERCGSMHSYPTIAPCYWCKSRHPSTAWTLEMLGQQEDGSWNGTSQFGFWIDELKRCGELIGRSLWSHRNSTNPRFVRTVPVKPQDSQYGFEQADLTDPAVLRLFGLNRRGNKIILKHEGEVRVVGEFAEEQMEVIRKWKTKKKRA